MSGLIKSSSQRKSIASLHFGNVYVATHPFYTSTDDCHLYRDIDSIRHKPHAYRLYGPITAEADYSLRFDGGAWRGENKLAISWTQPMPGGNYWNVSFRGRGYFLTGVPMNQLGLLAASIKRSTTGLFDILTVWNIDSVLYFRLFTIQSLANSLIPLVREVQIANFCSRVEFCSDALGFFGLVTNTAFNGPTTHADYYRVSDDLTSVAHTILLSCSRPHRNANFEEGVYGNTVYSGGMTAGEMIESFCVDGRKLRIALQVIDAVDLTITEDRTQTFQDPGYQAFGGNPITITGYRYDLLFSASLSGHIEIIDFVPVYSDSLPPNPPVAPISWTTTVVNASVTTFGNSYGGSRTYYTGYGDGSPDPNVYTNPPPWTPQDPGIEYITRISPGNSESLTINGTRAHLDILTCNQRHDCELKVLKTFVDGQTANWLDDYSSLVQKAEYYGYPYSHPSAQYSLVSTFGSSVSSQAISGAIAPIYGYSNDLCYIANGYLSPPYDYTAPVNIQMSFVDQTLTITPGHLGHVIGLSN